jgi:hypothetical protein
MEMEKVIKVFKLVKGRGERPQRLSVYKTQLIKFIKKQNGGLLIINKETIGKAMEEIKKTNEEYKKTQDELRKKQFENLKASIPILKL